MRANPDRQRLLLHARDGGRRVPPAPSRGTLKTRKETMSAIWRSLVLKPKSATLSGQRTTTSMPNIISDRCAQTQKGRKRFCFMAPTVRALLEAYRSRSNRSPAHCENRDSRLVRAPSRFFAGAEYGELARQYRRETVQRSRPGRVAAGNSDNSAGLSG